MTVSEGMGWIVVEIKTIIFLLSFLHGSNPGRMLPWILPESFDECLWKWGITKGSKRDLSNLIPFPWVVSRDQEQKSSCRLLIGWELRVETRTNFPRFSGEDKLFKFDSMNILQFDERCKQSYDWSNVEFTVIVKMNWIRFFFKMNLRFKWF